VLASVVIDRTYSRQFLPKSSSSRTLCLSVEFSDSFRPTSVVPTTYALPLATTVPQPLCNQSVTHSFYLDGGMPAIRGYARYGPTPRQRSPRLPIPCSLFPLFSISWELFCVFCTPKKSTLLFSSDSALFAKKKNGGWGSGYLSDRQVFGNSAWSKWATLSAPRHASHESPVTSHQARTRVSQVQPKMEGLSLCMSTFDLESLAESAELELAMVFVLGRLVRPHHGLR